ncbi:MAG: c-type cytochrome [Flavobacteriaceae bacterium]|jgi:cytochrome c oxidase cbb3-type subunit 3|nr:c-type cytochrome [Flavobacteriaceae bacterium]
MKPRTPVYLNILLILGLLFIIYYMFAQNTSFLQSPYFWGTAVIAVVLVYIHNAIGDLIENEKFKNLSETEKAAYLEAKNKPYFKSLYESAFKKQSDVEEKDILLDHGYDGIMELDNQLPKWWMGLFWLTIVYCVVYLISYSFTDFADPIKEYEADYKLQMAEIAEFEKNQPPVTVETAKYSADNIDEGKELFKTNCTSCHLEDGRGSIGPNLTDNYWINQKEKTLFRNIFWMLENGSPNDPTMVAFIKNKTISAKDAEKIAAYVYHINQEQQPISEKDGGKAREPNATEAHWESN